MRNDLAIRGVRTAEAPAAEPSSPLRQIPIPPSVYSETFERLSDAIGGGDYFTGSIPFRSGDLDCRFCATLIVYRQQVSCPEGERDEIRELVPVWWEFHTLRDGEELLNDFRFEELQNYFSD